MSENKKKIWWCLQTPVFSFPSKITCATKKLASRFHFLPNTRKNISRKVLGGSFLIPCSRLSVRKVRQILRATWSYGCWEFSSSNTYGMQHLGNESLGRIGNERSAQEGCRTRDDSRAWTFSGKIRGKVVRRCAAGRRRRRVLV